MYKRLIFLLLSFLFVFFNIWPQKLNDNFKIKEIKQINLSNYDPNKVIKFASNYIIYEDVKIIIIDSNGKKITELGGKGKAPGEFMFINSVSANSKGLIAVSDGLGHKVNLLEFKNNKLKFLKSVIVNGIANCIIDDKYIYVSCNDFSKGKLTRLKIFDLKLNLLGDFMQEELQKESMDKMIENTINNMMFLYSDNKNLYVLYRNLGIIEKYSYSNNELKRIAKEKIVKTNKFDMDDNENTNEKKIVTTLDKSGLQDLFFTNEGLFLLATDKKEREYIFLLNEDLSEKEKIENKLNSNEKEILFFVSNDLNYFEYYSLKNKYIKIYKFN